MGKKLFLLIFYELFHRIKMLPKNTSSPFRGLILRIGFAIDEGLGNQDVLLLFQRFDMRRQASVGDGDDLLQRIEIIAIIGDQHRHDLQPDAMLQYAV